MGNSHSDIKPAKENNNSVLKPAAKPGELEIIIKCSVEEMTKVFFKDYVIVWHDPNVNNKENQEYIAQLKKFCEVFTLTEWEKALAFVKETTAVCHVITSGTNGELLVKAISERENVCNIYVFCRNKEYHESWAKNYPKVSCVETHIQRLFNQIQQNLLEWYKKASSLNYNLPAFAPIFDDSDKSEMNHLHLYLKIIPNFKVREQAKEDFINLSKAIYTDQKNKEFIADFESNYNQYNKDNTLRWYTLESFLYKVTNNCLRIAIPDSIQYCRLALKDIEQAIKDQYQAKSKNFNGLLYRGAYLSEQEWLSLKENQDKEIEMHGFLSVSKVKNVALNFLKRDPSKMALITIIVPKGPNEEEQGFAEIEEYSQYPQEKEILFNVRSRFTVLETEDKYSEELPFRHLVLLYGAQGFRKFITEQNPIQEISISSLENLSCCHCKEKLSDMPERLCFVSLAESKRETYCCKKCIHSDTAPFLYVPITEKTGKTFKTEIRGCLLRNADERQTPFYGYKCVNCQAKKQKIYFTCIDCGGREEKWCEGCFEATSKCRESGHKIVLETSPFSFWCQSMSANELNHLKFHNNLVKENSHLFEQGEMYFESHEYEKAIKYYSLEIQANEGMGKTANLAGFYNNIGRVYDKQGEYKKALEHYFKSLSIYKSIYGDYHPSVATSYSNIGNVCNSQGEYKKALEYYFKSLDIRKSIHGSSHPDIAASSNNIGLVYYKQGENNKALEYFFKSLDIHKSIYGEHHPSVASSYNNIGLVYSKQREYEKVLEYYFKSLDIGKSIHGDNHPDIATSYGNIGVTYYAQKEYKKALEYYLKSLDIRKLVFPDNHPDIAASYNNIGLVYFHNGEYKEALEYYFKSVDIYKSIHGENHPLVATSYSNIGNLYDSQGEYNKALEYYLKSLDIRKSIYGDNHLDLATSYGNIGIFYKNQGEYKKALEYFFKSLEIYKSIDGENRSDVAILYNEVAGLCYKQGDNEKALEYSLKLLHVRKSIYGDNHPETALACSDIAGLYYYQGEAEKALEYYHQSLDMYESIYGDLHPRILNCYSNLAMVYSNLGEEEQAFEYQMRFSALKAALSLDDDDDDDEDDDDEDEDENENDGETN